LHTRRIDVSQGGDYAETFEGTYKSEENLLMNQVDTCLYFVPKHPNMINPTSKDYVPRLTLWKIDADQTDGCNWAEVMENEDTVTPGPTSDTVRAIVGMSNKEIANVATNILNAHEESLVRDTQRDAHEKVYGHSGDFLFYFQNDEFVYGFDGYLSKTNNKVNWYHSMVTSVDYDAQTDYLNFQVTVYNFDYKNSNGPDYTSDLQAGQPGTKTMCFSFYKIEEGPILMAFNDLDKLTSTDGTECMFSNNFQNVQPVEGASVHTLAVAATNVMRRSLKAYSDTMSFAMTSDKNGGGNFDGKTVKLSIHDNGRFELSMSIPGENGVDVMTGFVNHVEKEWDGRSIAGVFAEIIIDDGSNEGDGQDAYVSYDEIINWNGSDTGLGMIITLCVSIIVSEPKPYSFNMRHARDMVVFVSPSQTESCRGVQIVEADYFEYDADPSEPNIGQVADAFVNAMNYHTAHETKAAFVSRDFGVGGLTGPKTKKKHQSL